MKITPSKLSDLIKKGKRFEMNEVGGFSALRPKKSEYGCYAQLAELLSALLRNKLFASVADRDMIERLSQIRNRMESIARGEEDNV